MATTLATLLHLVVLVYWLGGDLGAFYGSRYLTNPSRTLPERMLSLKTLNDIDMAPKTALALALPTGLLLAWIKGWLPVAGLIPLLVGVAATAWVALIWSIHLAHDRATELRRFDIAVRWVVMPSLLGSGVAGLTGALAMPFFIACKLIVLGLCIGMGLIVRRQLAPLFPAVRQMAASGATPDTDHVIARVIANTRPVVVAIWALLLVAAGVGVATPV